MSGCAQAGLVVPWNDDSDTVHFLVLGFGLISVAKPDTEPAVLATQMHSVGLTVSDQPGLRVGIGYADGSVVAIPADAERTRVEVSRRPGGPIVVDTAECTDRPLEERQP